MVFIILELNYVRQIILLSNPLNSFMFTHTFFFMEKQWKELVIVFKFFYDFLTFIKWPQDLHIKQGILIEYKGSICIIFKTGFVSPTAHSICIKTFRDLTTLLFYGHILYMLEVAMLVLLFLLAMLPWSVRAI